MKIKWQFIIFFGVLFVCLAGLIFLLFKDSWGLLIAAEIGLGVFLLAFIWLIRDFTRPLDQIKLGLDALKDQDFSTKLRPSASGEINLLVDVYNQMIENLRKERTYQQEQHFFMQNLIEMLPVGLVILDFDEKISQYNPTAERILELDKNSLGTSFAELVTKLMGADIALESGKTYRLGSSKYILVHLSQFKHQGFYRKFIILEENTEEVLRIEKKSYGKVIRMMAHEVKNSVGAINSILETLKEVGELDEQERNSYLDIVVQRNHGLNTFVNNFGAVVRLPEPHLEVIGLGGLLSSVYHIMKLKLQQAHVNFVLDLPDHEVFLKCDREQMEQVLINAIINAFESVGENGQVKLKLSASHIEIIDNGKGIDPGIQSKLFTPFFSTKPTGQGVGLTLSREILINHGFGFSLATQEGVTRFVIIIA